MDVILVCYEMKHGREKKTWSGKTAHNMYITRFFSFYVAMENTNFTCSSCGSLQQGPAYRIPFAVNKGMFCKACFPNAEQSAIREYMYSQCVAPAPDTTVLTSFDKRVTYGLIEDLANQEWILESEIDELRYSLENSDGCANWIIEEIESELDQKEKELQKLQEE